MLENIKIRTDLRPGDMGKIIALHGEMYAREYHYGLTFEAYVCHGFALFYEQYKQHKGFIWILESEDHIVGSLAMVDEGDSAQLRYFFLLPEFRGVGLGAHLMKLFFEKLKSTKYRRAFLWTTSDLPAAASLYKKFGFKLVEERQGDFGRVVVEQKYAMAF